MRGYNIQLLDDTDTVLYDFGYSFSSSKLTLGTVDASALEKFDSADEFLRRGDNLLSPEMLVIFGDVVKSSVMDLRKEVNDIRDVLLNTTKVLYISASTKEYEFIVVPKHIMEVKEIKHGRTAARIKINLNTGHQSTGIPLPILWHDAAEQVYIDAGTTEAAHGDLVQQWNNKMDPSTPAIQTSTTLKPPLDTTTFSFPTVKFNGSDTRLNLGYWWTGEGTIFTLLHAIPEPTVPPSMGWRGICGWRRIDGNNARSLATDRGDNGKQYFSVGGGGIAHARRVVGDWYIQNATYSASDNEVKIFIDDKLIESTTLTGTADIVDTSAVGYLGAVWYQGNPVNHFKGYLSDFLIYDRVLSESERKRVVKHLQEKAGIQTHSPPNGVNVDLWIAADSGVYADYGITPAVTTNNITQWHDKSGVHRPVYRGGGSGRVSLQTVDGITALYFNGVGYLQHEYWDDYGTVFVVSKLTSDSNAYRTLLSYWKGSTFANLYFRSRIHGSANTECNFDGYGAIFTPRIYNSWYISHARQDSTNGLEFSIDGVVKGTTTGTRVAPPFNVAINKRPVIGTAYYNTTKVDKHFGYIAEVIASKRRMDDTEYNSVLSYLQTKYASVLP